MCNTKILSRVEVTTDGFWIRNGFNDHLQMVTTGNYNTLANTCTRLLTAAHSKSSQLVFTIRFLVTDPNNVLCLRSYWLENVSQLNPKLAVTTQQRTILLTKLK
jgi:hypothetical protein